MKLDTWQVRLLVRLLENGMGVRRTPKIRGQADIARSLERKALEAMAAALESGESLEVGP